MNHYWKDTGNTSSHWSSSTDTCVEQYPSLKDLEKQQLVMDVCYCFSWGKNASRSAGLTQWPETIPSQDTIPKTDLNKNKTNEQQNNNKIHIVIQVLFNFKTSTSLILFLIKWGQQQQIKVKHTLVPLGVLPAEVFCSFIEVMGIFIQHWSLKLLHALYFYGQTVDVARGIYQYLYSLISLHLTHDI